VNSDGNTLKFEANTTSITKGCKLSFFDKKCFQEMASMGLKVYLNQFRWRRHTGPHRGS